MHLRILHVGTHLEDCTAICLLKSWVIHLYGRVFCVFDIIIIDYLKILQIKWLAYYNTMILGNILRYGALNPIIPLIKKKKKEVWYVWYFHSSHQIGSTVSTQLPKQLISSSFWFQISQRLAPIGIQRMGERSSPCYSECLPTKSLQSGSVPLLRTKPTTRQPLPTGNLPSLCNHTPSSPFRPVSSNFSVHCCSI